MPRVRVLVLLHSDAVSPQLIVSPFAVAFPSIEDGFRVDFVVFRHAHSSAPALKYYPVQPQCHAFFFDVSSEAGLPPFLQLPMCREVDHIQPFMPRKRLVSKKIRYACRNMCCGTIELKT